MRDPTSKEKTENNSGRHFPGHTQVCKQSSEAGPSFYLEGPGTLLGGVTTCDLELLDRELLGSNADLTPSSHSGEMSAPPLNGNCPARLFWGLSRSQRGDLGSDTVENILATVVIVIIFPVRQQVRAALGLEKHLPESPSAPPTHQQNSELPAISSGCNQGFN